MAFCADIENIILDYKKDLDFVDKYSKVLLELATIRHTTIDTPYCLTHRIFKSGSRKIFVSYTTAFYEQMPNLYIETYHEHYVNYGLLQKVIMLEEIQELPRSRRPYPTFKPSFDVDSDFYESDEYICGCSECM